MKLFIDTANIDEIKEVASWGILSGVTTNPSLLAKEENTDPKSVVREIAELVDGPISAEVISLDTDGMIKEAERLSDISPNIVVKVPMTAAGLAATRILAQKNIKTNVTLVFSANQALLAMNAGANFVSPFVGRIDDAGQEGLEVVKEAVEIIHNYGFETEVIAASIRHPLHVTAAALIGAHIATIPYAVFKSMVKHPLTDIGIERFIKDWESIKNV